MMPFSKKSSGRVAGSGLRTSKSGLVATYAVLTIAAVAIGFPILFSISLSFTPLEDIINGVFIPTSLFLDNYVNAFEAQPFAQFIVNSVVVGVAAGQVLDGDPKIVNALRHIFVRNNQ